MLNTCKSNDTGEMNDDRRDQAEWVVDLSPCMHASLLADAQVSNRPAAGTT